VWECVRGRTLLYLTTGGQEIRREAREN
jgi:hypothetical protein